MLLETILIFCAVGLAVGLLAGLFGIGGGLIVVPALALVLPGLGTAEAVVMHLAVGTSLGTVTLTSSASAWSHHRLGAVDWPIFRRLAAGLVVGAVLGAVIAGELHSAVLATVFGVFALGMAAYIAWSPSPERARPGPPAGWLPLAGAALGVLPSILGVGGGILLVPFLLWRGLRPVQAVATSAACTVPVGLAGALGHLATGFGAPGLPPGSLGYLHLPALAGIALMSMLAAPWGARIAHRLPRHRLRRGFALLLAGVGVWMLAS